MSPLLSLLHALREAEVDFVVVGGVAVVLRGHPRMTVDLDVALDLSASNVERALTVLTAAGLVPRLPVPVHAFADPETRAGWVRDRNLLVFSLHDPNDPRREVDIFAEDPVPYAELLAAADNLRVGEVEVPVASIAHLIEMKQTAGRPQDLADIEALQRIVDADRGDA